MNAYPAACPESERRLLAVLRPPSDQPGREAALRASAHALHRFARGLKNPRLELEEIVADYAPYHGSPEPCVGGLHRRQSRYPLWGLVTGLSTDAPDVAVEAFGALIACALIDNKQLPLGLARCLARAMSRQGKYRDERRLSGVVLAARMRFEAIAVERAGPSLRARLERFYRALDEYAGEHTHQSRPHPRTLSAERYRCAARDLRARVEQGEDAAIWMAVCAVTGLGVELAGATPLRGNEETLDIAIDVSAGTLLLDLDILAPNARTIPGQAVEAVSACRILVRPLPAFLADALAVRLRFRPDASCVAELLACSPPNERTQLTEHDYAGGFKPSLARFTQTTEAFAVRCGIDRVHAGHVSGRYQTATRSKLYYAAISRHELWAAAQRLFDEVDWGPAMPLVPGLAAGAQAVATDASAARWFAWMRETLREQAPGRRYTLASVIRHHNCYARLVASVSSLCLALRQRNPLPIAADADLTSGWIALTDKRTATVWNPTVETAMLHAVPACRLVRAQLACWRRHCGALARRLAHLNVPQTEEFRVHLEAVAAGEGVAAFVELDRFGTPRVLGSRDLELWWPAWFAHSGNWGRAFWQTRLTQRDVPSQRVDLLLRHTQSGVRPMANVGATSVVADVAAICRAQDALLQELGIDVTPGLVK